MVSISILVSLLTISVSTITAYSLPPTGGESGLYKGDLAITTPNDLHTRALKPRPSWDKYNKDTADLTKLGLCRYYIEASSCCDNLVICQRYCNSNSVSCRAGDYRKDPSIISDEPNPNGERYTRGVCECNVDLQKHIAELIMEMSKDAGGIICEVWLESFQYAAQILTTLALPASIPLHVFRGVLKTVQYANTVSGIAGFTTINKVITDTCGSDVINASKADIFKEAYKQLTKIDINKIKAVTA
ncbi:hypothetical protein BGZ60DRAFT_421340 [Tricladium varicosporioides]|nr:hypothetical protein BGZ60DRAFT_421340 [Hymenoscyphus varicosporioides]